MQLLVLQMGVNAFYNNVSLFPIVTVQAAIDSFARKEYASLNKRKELSWKSVYY